MCDPVTLAVMTGVSVAASTASAYQQSSAQKQNAEFQAKVAERNADIQNEAALDASRRGAQKELANRQKVRALIASQDNQFAGSGVDGSSGSALRVIENNVQFGELDSLIIRNNAERESYNARIGASNSLSQASAFNAQTDSINPTLNAGMTLITGATGAASKWNQWKANG